MDVCDLGGGSGPPRLHTGGAKNLWVKKNHHTRGERLKMATYSVRTLLKDEHVQELEEALKENNMKWDVIALGEVRRQEESFTTLQSGHLLYHSDANDGQAGVGFLVNKKWKDNIMLNTRAERRKLLNKNTRKRVDTQMIGTKKNTFQLELKKQVHSTRRT